jgi:hypothetical protein
MTVMPRDPATANRLMLTLGAIVIRFGEFEVARQGAIVTIHHGADERLSGKGDGKKRLPADIFAEGSKYMRESVRFDGMSPFAIDIERIMDTADRLAKQRNHIVHGFIAEFVDETRLVLFRKFNVDRSDDTYLGSPLEMTLADLEMLRDDATAMAAEMTDLAARLLRAFFGDTESQPILHF